ncbi:MAG TPA: hypothetical protein DCE56_17840 [Cyanobacteria bacterium UBA8553]|nr:hypothetical protein [Cyanobacteria bacterium UBA8553]
MKIETSWQFTQIRQLKDWIKQEKPLLVILIL